MENIVLRLLRLYFGLVGRIAPGLVAKQAFKLFCTPRRRSTPPLPAQRILDSATPFRVRYRDGWLQAYRWARDAAATADATAPAVLLAHGWDSQASRLTKWVAPLLENGYQVVAFDAPAHGASDGRRTNPPDYAAAIVEVEKEAGPFHAIVAHSLGVMASTLAVAGEELIEGAGFSVDKLVFVAGPDRTLDAIARFGEIVGVTEKVIAGIHAEIQAASGHPIEAYSVSRLLAPRGIPVLLIHDRQDDEVFYADAEAVAAAVPSARLVTTEGLGHHVIMRDAGVMEEAIAFLAEDAGSERAVA